MKLKKLLLLSILVLPLTVFCQKPEYSISIEDRDTAISLTNKVINLIDNNKYREAIALLEKSVSIDSVYQPAYLQMCKAYMWNNNFSDKVPFYMNRAKRIFNDDDELCYYLGEFYRMKNELRKAIKEYNMAIELGKKNAEGSSSMHLYFFNRGVCYLKAEMLNPAYSDFSEVLRLKPNYSNALVNRGICLYKQKKSQEACADWRKSVKMGNPAAKGYLAKYDK